MSTDAIGGGGIALVIIWGGLVVSVIKITKE